jgi:hypothetical protein
MLSWFDATTPRHTELVLWRDNAASHQVWLRRFDLVQFLLNSLTHLFMFASTLFINVWAMNLLQICLIFGSITSAIHKKRRRRRSYMHIIVGRKIYFVYKWKMDALILRNQLGLRNMIFQNKKLGLRLNMIFQINECICTGMLRIYVYKCKYKFKKS